MSRLLPAFVVSLVVVMASTGSAQSDRWQIFIDSHYFPEGPAKNRHPSSHVEEVRVPRDSPFGLVACSSFSGGGTPQKGRISVNVALLRPSANGVLLELEAQSLSAKIQGVTNLCPIGISSPSQAGDIVRFEYSFKKASKLSFPRGLVHLSSSISADGP